MPYLNTFKHIHEMSLFDKVVLDRSLRVLGLFVNLHIFRMARNRLKGEIAHSLTNTTVSVGSNDNHFLCQLFYAFTKNQTMLYYFNVP